MLTAVWSSCFAVGVRPEGLVDSSAVGGPLQIGVTVGAQAQAVSETWHNRVGSWAVLRRHVSAGALMEASALRYKCRLPVVLPHLLSQNVTHTF